MFFQDFEQSKEGDCLSGNAKVIDAPKHKIPICAKTVTTMIDPDKIGMIIGTGGKVIKEIQENSIRNFN